MLLAIIFKALVHRPENIAPPCLGNKLIALPSNTKVYDHNVVDVYHLSLTVHLSPGHYQSPQTTGTKAGQLIAVTPLALYLTHYHVHMETVGPGD